MKLLTQVGTLCVYLCLCASTPVRSPGTKMTVQSHPMLASLFNTANTVQQIELSNREFGAAKARNRAGKGIGAIKKIPINFEKKSIELVPIVAPGLKPIRGTKQIFKGTPRDSSKSIVADTTEFICSYCQQIQNATCIEIYCFNNAQAASSAVFIPNTPSKMQDNNVNVVPLENLQNEVSVMSNSINRPQILGDPIFSQLETVQKNIHQERGIQHAGHGIIHPGHGIKQPAHVTNHPGHGIKQQGHEISHPSQGIKQSAHAINHPAHGINKPGHKIKQSADGIKHPGHGIKKSASGIKHLGHGIRQPGHGIKHPTHGIKHPGHEIIQQEHGLNHHGGETKHTEGHTDSSHQIRMLSTENGHVVPPHSHSPSQLNTEHPNSAIRKRPELHALAVNQGLSPMSLDPLKPAVNDVHLHQAKPVATPTNINDPLPVNIAAVIPLDSNVHHHQGTETLPVESDVIANPALLSEHVVAAIVPQDMLQTLPVQPASLDPVTGTVNSGVLHEATGPGLVIVGTGPFILEHPNNIIVDVGQGNLDTVIRDHVPHLDGSQPPVQSTDVTGHSGSAHHNTLSGGSGHEIGKLKSEPLFPEQSTSAVARADQGNPVVLPSSLGLDPVIVGDQRQVNPVQHETHIHNDNLSNHLPVDSITNDHTTAIHHGSDISAHSGDHTAHSHSTSNTDPTQKQSATVLAPTSSSESVFHPQDSSIPSDTLSNSDLQSDLIANTDQLSSLEQVFIDAMNQQQAVLSSGNVNNVQSSIAPGTLEVLPDNNQPVNIPGARPFDAMNPLTGNDVIAQVPASNPAVVQVPSAQNFQSLKPHTFRAGIQRSRTVDRREGGQDQARARASSTGRDRNSFVSEHGNPIITFSKLDNSPRTVQVTESETPNLGTGVPGRGIAMPTDTLAQAVADKGWVQEGSTVTPTIVTLSPQRKAELNALSKVFLSDFVP